MAKYNEEIKKRMMEYQAEHIRPVKFSFSIENDADILAKLDEVGNKAKYVKTLIRADIARAKSEEERRLNMNRIDICTIALHGNGAADEDRQTISWDPDTKRIYSSADSTGAPIQDIPCETFEAAVDVCDAIYNGLGRGDQFWLLEWIERD